MGVGVGVGVGVSVGVGVVWMELGKVELKVEKEVEE